MPEASLQSLVSKLVVIASMAGVVPNEISPPSGLQTQPSLYYDAEMSHEPTTTDIKHTIPGPRSEVVR